MIRKRAFGGAVGIALVVTATLYTAALCFLNTHVLTISNTLVAICDGGILLLALAMALRGGSHWLWIGLAALAVNFLVFALLSERIDPKAIRDPLVLIAFAALGWRFGDFRRARTAFFTVSAIVAVFALFELLAPKAFTGFFNVLRFYEARGMVGADALQRLDSAFFISSAREGDRLLLPILGTHRVSSIFLEPVSMGNFGAIALAYAFALNNARWRTALTAALIGISAIVLADARFASMAAMFFVVARLLPAGWTRIGVTVLPLIALGALTAFALSDIGAGDDLPTRLAGSGRTLLSMSPAAVFGFAPYRIVTFDAGYAYAMSAFGLPMCILLWLAFVAVPTPTREAERYKLLLAVYMCSLLCVSGTSLFALKTAALGFFMFGALCAQNVRVVAASPRRVSAAPQATPA